MKTLIFGHKNPDTDSVCSAIAYSFLKNSLNEETEPRVLGEIKNEARYVLDHFHLPYPEILDNRSVFSQKRGMVKAMPHLAAIYPLISRTRSPRGGWVLRRWSGW